MPLDSHFSVLDLEARVIKRKNPQVVFNELFSPRLLPVVEEANGNTESEDDAEKAAEPPISKTAFIYKPIITLGLLLV